MINNKNVIVANDENEQLNSLNKSSIDSFINSARSENRFISKPADKFIADQNQPRKDFDEEKLLRLQRDIEEIGQLQPLMVKPEEGGKYQIIVGERRWRAISNSTIIKNVDAVILSDEADELKILRMQIQENDNRVGVSILEEAAALIRGIDLNKKLNADADEKSTGKMLGISSSKISKSRAILNAPDIIKSLSLDNIVNDYGSLYDLARVYKKYPDQITDLITKIRAGKINNIRSSVKKMGVDLSGSKVIEVNVPDKNDAQETEQADNTLPVGHKNNDLLSQSKITEGRQTEQQNTVLESSLGTETKAQNPHLKTLISGQIIDDVDFIHIGESTVMKLLIGSEEYAFTLQDEALESLSMFIR